MKAMKNGTNISARPEAKVFKATPQKERQIAMKDIDPVAKAKALNTQFTNEKINFVIELVTSQNQRFGKVEEEVKQLRQENKDLKKLIKEIGSPRIVHTLIDASGVIKKS